MSSSTPVPPLTYEQAGVNYDLIDPLKVAAQRAAAETGAHLGAHGFSEVAASRGESAYVVDVGPFYLASIIECLGTKTLVADEMREITGRATTTASRRTPSRWRSTTSSRSAPRRWWCRPTGPPAAPTGSRTPERAQALVAGWKRACDACGVAWGGGETPALAGIVEAGRIDLAASCIGIVSPKARLSLGDKLAAGDAIVLLASSGIHANGMSTRAQAGRARCPMATDAASATGLKYGEALLAPTVLYSPVTEALAAAGIVPHYSANVTGHGWRKLMRHPERS